MSGNNVYTELALSSAEENPGETEEELRDSLWTCLNIVQDFSVHRRGDYKIIHRAIMAAQEVARRMKPE